MAEAPWITKDRPGEELDISGSAFRRMPVPESRPPHLAPRVALVATDGITPPITFGQGSDPEILGTVTVGVHHLVD